MTNRVAAVTLLVNDYDDAIEYFTGTLGLHLLEDEPAGVGKRWVRVGAPNAGASLVLAVATTDAQRARVGDQFGGRVGCFLHTDDFAHEHARLLAAGVEFLESPRVEPYGRVAVFRDRYGNRWDLIQPADA